MIRHARLAGALVAACLSAAALAQSADYPTRPITVVVPFAPGGVTDLTARAYAQQMSRDLAQPIITENRPGGGATIGADHVARAKPDGYTVLFGTNVTHAMSPRLLPATRYDPIKDFIPVGTFGHNGNVLLVARDFPVKDFGQFVEYIRARPGKVNYASGSIGSSAHLAAELLKLEVQGLDYTHVPYGGPAEAMSALIGGHVDFLFANIGAAVSQLQSGKVRALAVTTARRVEQLPEVPTVAESGVPGFEVVGWMAAFVPAGTPEAVVQRLNRSITAAQDQPELRKILDTASVIPLKESPQELAAFVQSEYDKWGRVIREANIQPQ